MKAFLIILACILFLLWMPLVLRVRYSGNLTVSAGIFCPFLRIYPMKKRKKAKKKEKEKAPSPERVALRAQWELVYDLIQRSPDYFRRLIRFSRLKFLAIIGNEDPGDLALEFGRLNALIGTLVPIINPIYSVEKWSVSVRADFDKTESEYDVEVGCSTNLWRIIGVLISVLVRGIILKRDDKETLNDGK